MQKTIELVNLRKDARKLEGEFDNGLLLDITRRFKKITDADNVENRMYMEATQDLLEALESGETTIKSFYEDLDTVFRTYEKFLKEYKSDVLTRQQESALRVHLTLPFDLLLALYIINHPEYTTEDELWELEDQLQPFTDALDGGD